MIETDTAGWQAFECLCAQIMGWPSADSITISNYQHEQGEFLSKTQVCFGSKYPATITIIQISCILPAGDNSHCSCDKCEYFTL